jgi:hypothetical protein
MSWPVTSTIPSKPWPRSTTANASVSTEIYRTPTEGGAGTGFASGKTLFRPISHGWHCRVFLRFTGERNHGHMPALTRRRSLDAPDGHVYYGDVRVGTIAIRTGIPPHEDPWGWNRGFYPGSHPRECTDGTAETFDQARADFEAAWRVSVEPNRSRFSGVARRAGLDRAQICDVASRRATAVAETKLAHEMPVRRNLR